MKKLGRSFLYKESGESKEGEGKSEVLEMSSHAWQDGSNSKIIINASFLSNTTCG
jgi:hypothetical protein